HGESAMLLQHAIGHRYSRRHLGVIDMGVEHESWRALPNPIQPHDNLGGDLLAEVLHLGPYAAFLAISTGIDQVLNVRLQAPENHEFHRLQGISDRQQMPLAGSTWHEYEPLLIERLPTNQVPADLNPLFLRCPQAGQ